MSQQQCGDLWYKSLVDGVTDHAIFMLSPDGHVSSWNTGAERIKGYRAEDIIGRHFSLFYDQPDLAADVPNTILATARSQGRCEREGWRLRQDGTSLWAKVVIHALYDQGHLTGFAKITRDCTREREQACALEAMVGNLRLVLSLLPYGACLLDEHHHIVLFNPVFRNLFPAAVEGAHLPGLIKHRLVQEGLDDAYTTAVSAGALADAGGTPQEIILGTSIIAVQVQEAPGYGWVAAFEDVTERRKAERRMLHSVRHDAMTGLANREGLHAYLDAALKAHDETAGHAILCLDLDCFKRINDTFGHHAGDLVLKETARRILDVLRPEDFACRLGGDEFVVVADGCFTMDQAMRVAERLSEQLHQPFLIDGRAADVGVSIGIAVSDRGAINPVDLMDAADMALYQAKRDGRGRIRCYDEDLGIAVLKRRSLELQLRHALETNEFSLVYQPICSADEREIKGFEALLRWRQADGTPVSPAEFVPIAEELGIMTAIGGWVLQTACREAVTWPAPLAVAVNVSVTQLRDESLLHCVRSALDESGLHPSRLELEITETAMMGDHDLPVSILRKLRDVGVKIALDDFGTGYSSLSILHTLPFTRIKIDRSFIRDITENANSLAIVRGLMRISHDLGVSVTAEGVETEEQRETLIVEACHELQGYLIARPMPGDQVSSFLGLASPTQVALSA